ncbi:hypothetical protein ANTQUA_LOCUS8396 [Anthophora quadrimaculata]
MVQIMQNRTERPSAIVCIAYRQLSAMTGIKDPTEEPKVEQIKQESKEMNAIVKKRFTDLTNVYMQDFFEFSRNMTESFRSMLNDLKVHIELFREQNKSLFDLFSLSNLQKWFEHEK